MKKVIAALLLLSLALGLCACVSGNSNETTAPSEPSTATDPTQAPTDPTVDQEDAYVVTVVDTEGNPIAGAFVQLCKLGDDGACVPGATDAQGKATFKLEKDDYKVSFVTMPSGYDYVDDVTDFYFEEGSMELTITVKKA